MKAILLAAALTFWLQGFGWGFYAHRLINRHAVFMLPREMLVLFKPGLEYLTARAVAPDIRRYVVEEEGPRHFIDLDLYGAPPCPDLPRSWKEAVTRYSEDTLMSRGIAPWWIIRMQKRLTAAFSARNGPEILRLSAELGHYVADIHVPLHAHSNYNGQHTGQSGIHAFWESRIPELLAEKDWDLVTGKASYIRSPDSLIWRQVMESAAAADSVLEAERRLRSRFPQDRRYVHTVRNGVLTRTQSEAYCRAFDRQLRHMTERRFREAVIMVACLWYTAWVDAGQPPLPGTEAPSSEDPLFEEALPARCSEVAGSRTRSCAETAAPDSLSLSPQ